MGKGVVDLYPEKIEVCDGNPDWFVGRFDEVRLSNGTDGMSTDSEMSGIFFTKSSDFSQLVSHPYAA